MLCETTKLSALPLTLAHSSFPPLPKSHAVLGTNPAVAEYTHLTPWPQTSSPAAPGESSVTKWHALKAIEQAAPVVGKHLRVLDPLLGPILVPARDIVLGVLEVDKLVAETFLDKDRPVVLIDNGFFVLLFVLACAQETVVRGNYSTVQLALMIASTTFSISPGFTMPSGFARRAASLFSFVAIRRSR